MKNNKMKKKLIFIILVYNHEIKYIKQKVIKYLRLPLLGWDTVLFQDKKKQIQSKWKFVLYLLNILDNNRIMFILYYHLFHRNKTYAL